MELFNVHIIKYRGGGLTAERLGGRGVALALGMEARRVTTLGVIHDSPAESGVSLDATPVLQVSEANVPGTHCGYSYG